MRVIDFIGLGVEDLTYVITDGTPKVIWRGTRQDFVREMSAFFLLFHRQVRQITVACGDVLILYI